MNNEDIFDSANGCHSVEWNKLPRCLQYFFSSQQKSILDRVKRKVVEKYGEAGLQDLVKTSGWRSVAGNRVIGGVVNSLHLYGCAIDFAKKGIFKDNPIPVCCDLQCIDSGKCWHVQFKRS